MTSAGTVNGNVAHITASDRTLLLRPRPSSILSTRRMRMGVTHVQARPAKADAEGAANVLGRGAPAGRPSRGGERRNRPARFRRRRVNRAPDCANNEEIDWVGTDTVAFELTMLTEFTPCRGKLSF